MPVLVLLNEDRSTQFFELIKDRTTLGSRPDNDISVPIKGVSRKHAQILKLGGRFILEDLDSTNFVFVNQQQVDKFALVDNTSFSLGDYAYFLYLEQKDQEKIDRFLTSRMGGLGDGDRTTRIFTKAMPKSVKELEALIEVGAHINSMLDLDAVLKEIIDKVLSMMRAERGFIMLTEGDKLVPVVAKNMDADLRDAERHAFSQSFARKVIEKAETIISTNVAEDERYKSESIISQKILSIMCAPLKAQDRIIGCLYVDIRETTRFFSEKDAAFFSALANQAAIAIQNARLTENLKKNQIFLEQTNAQLQRSLEKLIETNLRLDRKINELSVMFEVSKSLNMAQDMDALLKSILKSTRQVLSAERGSLMVMNEQLGGLVVKLVDGVDKIAENRTVLKLGEGIAGTVAETGQGRIVNRGSQDDAFKYALKRDSDIRQMICVPLVSEGRCIGVINLTNNRGNKNFSQDDLNLLTSIANLAAVTMEKFRLYRDKVNQERLNLELEDARKVQQLLLPRAMPEFPLFEFAAKYALANRVGGDYYDFITIDENRLAVVIADVSGHDIASALVMAMGRNMVRTFFSRHQSPAEVLSKTSFSLRQDTQSQRYITMFVGILDAKEMTFTYSNAGHNYPLYLAAGSDEYRPLSVGGFPLGLVDDYTYLEETVKLSPLDLLILYTDGLIEAQAPGGEMFELTRVEDLVRNYRDRPMEDLADHLYTSAVAFAETEKLQDDFTFLAIRTKAADSELHATFESKTAALQTQVRQISAFIQRCGFFEQERYNLVLVIKEALANAIEHGNKSDPARRVHVSVVPDHKQLTIRVRDEGEGFPVSGVMAKQKKDPSGKRGKGLLLIEEYTDRVEFNDRGNEIRLVFTKQPKGRPCAPA
ncbi:MAG: SpoIIE family protein phosphatase [Candidatus Wallbacteria bacterium]|nr:SpoIIE family protein phosphatase [Candidatus Wallbacteria bacterium]